MTIPILETKRLLMRPPIADDFDAWAAFLADEHSTRFLGGPQTRTQAWRSIAIAAGCWSLQGFSMFSVIEKETGQWIGRIGPWRPVGWPGNEITWGITRAAQGRGFALEGTIAAIDWVFATLDWTEVIHTIEQANEGSAALARRLGSVLCGKVDRPEPFVGAEADLWMQTRGEWLGRRA
ncbi:GNAT family N-acetyltransferase [Acidisoma cellulosilytica]|uniref:GNAT family N-acetyltransferase n=1 Tax=Acidisoma cellulosilyticum TaxID=2802395 RepID=A0A963Z733_9PROT|nr:GNAT family N-acetyltransferase [Acidisoma cellulosilyticum]MCB8883791.1 GNAT family N-acetyltransferase [Acidisoma cellulosilyticum]